MKISFGWLKELVDLKWSPEESARRLEELGLEVSGIEKTGGEISGVVSAKILEVAPHPNADRLSVCKINDGKNTLTVVCGAKNIAPGQTVPLAEIGAKLTGGTAIARTEIRGVESSGMLCSPRELGLSDDHSGILQLDAGTAIGRPINEILPLSDTVLEIEVTPNRPDCLSHIGVARELAAASGKTLKGRLAPKQKTATGKFPIRIDSASDCPRYIGTVVKNVQIKSSPLWLSRRLTLCGIRPINNIVDVTNYVLLEYGHPLHAFDLSKLQGSQINVRRAHEGESLAALDEKTYALSPDVLVIADQKTPLAVAGVIGGTSSSIHDGTRDILLEAASFERGLIRRASKSLGVRTESSYRFERGVPAAGAQAAAERALKLILELAGGKVESVTDAYPGKRKAISVSLRPARLNDLLEMNLKPAEIKNRLQSLGFSAKPGKKGMLSCEVPAWRLDIEGEHDLTEEVARLVGYDKIPARLLSPSPDVEENRGEGNTAGRRARQTLLSHGFWEACSSAFVSCKTMKHLDPLLLQTAVAIANPLSDDQEYLRPNLSLGLLAAVKKNRSLGTGAASLFEVGSAFERIGQVGDEPAESRRVALLVTNDGRAKHWREAPGPADFFEIKSWCELLLDVWGVSDAAYSPISLSFLHPGASASISASGKTLGWAGLIHPGIAKALDIPAETAIAEFDLATVAQDGKVTRFRELPKYPPVKRDLSVTVKKDVTWEQIETCARESAGETLETLRPFDVFSGGNIASDEKSLAFSLSLRRRDRTLTDAEADGVISRIITALEQQLSARLRS